MAKGSVRKKGNKWYYRFYVENESGKQVQKEFAGTESKSETEAMLRKAMEDYEAKKIVTRSENITVGQLLDMWVEEELKPGTLSNGTVMLYQSAISRIKRYPIADRKLKSVTPEHLQRFFDLLAFGGTRDDGSEVKPLAGGTICPYSAIMQGAFRFAVFPKRLMTFNPMQYVKVRKKQETLALFTDGNKDSIAVPTISYEQYTLLTDWLKRRKTRLSFPSRSPTSPVFGSERSALSPGRTSTSRSRRSPSGAVYATMRRGTRRKSGRPNGAKFARWISATLWRRSSERPDWNRTRTGSCTARCTA